jgi:bifunctional non-homologous end joining protein LigD
MLATAVSALPPDEGWSFEFKWDGVRALFDVSDRGLRITSRLGNDVTSAYPELSSQAEDVGDALVDGEIVAIVDGRPSFELLQTRMHVRSPTEARALALQTPVTFVAFDLLRRYGVDLTGRPYVERRATLERWALDRSDWTVSPTFDDGVATEAAARQHGLEGVVAKRLTSRYRPGARGSDWLKLRFVQSGEFVVIGWEGAADSPTRLSSLLLGYYDGANAGTLTFAGKVGSGLGDMVARRLQGQLSARDECPLPELPEASLGGRQAHWVDPLVVVEVEFSMWTGDGRLRHPVFRGIRTDKGPQEAIGNG